MVNYSLAIGNTHTYKPQMVNYSLIIGNTHTYKLQMVNYSLTLGNTHTYRHNPRNGIRFTHLVIWMDTVHVFNHAD